MGEFLQNRKGDGYLTTIIIKYFTTVFFFWKLIKVGSKVKMFKTTNTWNIS